VPDIRSALRARPGGGAGGAGAGRGGWGGITGEPIRLNDPDPGYREYLEQIKQRIQRHWGIPCKNPFKGDCDYRNAELQVMFGILKSGELQIVELKVSSGLPPYDEYAMNAIRLASPFPEVPPSLMRKAPPGSAGVPIHAHFTYNVTVSVESLLR
jgi:hypothetical protein